MSKIERAARYYVQQEIKGMLVPDISTGDMERAFIAGAKWAECNKVKTKTMCLRNKSKVCNLCHECDVFILNPTY